MQRTTKPRHGARSCLTHYAHQQQGCFLFEFIFLNPGMQETHIHSMPRAIHLHGCGVSSMFGGGRRCLCFRHPTSLQQWRVCCQQGGNHDVETIKTQLCLYRVAMRESSSPSTAQAYPPARLLHHEQGEDNTQAPFPLFWGSFW